MCKVHLKCYKWKSSTIQLNIETFQGQKRPFILFISQEIWLTRLKIDHFLGIEKTDSSYILLNLSIKRWINALDKEKLSTPFFKGFPGFYEVAHLWASSPSVGYLLFCEGRSTKKGKGGFYEWCALSVN